MGNSISDDIKKKAEALKSVLHRAPAEVGSIAVRHFKGNFRQQGFDGTAWPKRKKEPKNRKGRAILVRSGALSRSLRIVRADTASIVIGTDLPYAKIHNEGGTIVQAARSEIFKRKRIAKGTKKGRFRKGKTAGRGFTFKQRIIKIPARRFIGSSVQLTGKVDAWYKRNINNAIK